ncbi:TetR/AcrR family transcriptional regulator [Furfurilactobacillus curtus]|uniref:TetR family transcriptional regulator n=1 Tax=Furfurilactobacillus curtus TaxID=1746200 RepID=A0ABQ5JPF3_9LACO
MAKLTKAQILDTAELLVEQNGIQGVTLAAVGATLGVSHAALYKHFSNKQDLWTSLALRWLNQALQRLFPFDTSDQTDKLTIAHDWLWALTVDKMAAYHDDPRMFTVYTTYIDDNPKALTIHITDLAQSLAAALSTDKLTVVDAVLQAFSMFSAPAFAPSWGSATKAQFEGVWTLVAPGLKESLTT